MTQKNPIYLIQPGDTMRKERRALADLPRVTCSLGDLPTLPHDNYIPVGTVEFTKEFCRVKHIPLPDNISYPGELRGFLNREVRQDHFANVSGDMFVKPVNTKTFTGGIKRELSEDVKKAELVWVSAPINLSQEYRHYVIDGKVVGYSRYDDGEDENIEPDHVMVENMIEAYHTQPVGYSIDTGISNGRTVLVEVNDGWSLGLYPWGTMTDKSYVDLITLRWEQITKHQENPVWTHSC